MENQTILVTGANGLVGQKIIEQLAKINVKVIATGKGPSRIPYTPNAIYIPADITAPAEIELIFKEFSIHQVIHCAAVTNVDYCELHPAECYKGNVDAVRTLIQACEKHASKLIHVSTDFIFDGQEGPYDEDAKPNPLSTYGHSKLQAEQLVKKSKISWAIARTILVYGVSKDMSRSNIVLWVKKSLEEKKPIQVVIDQLRTPTLADDLAHGLILITLKNAEGIFNLGGKDKMTIFEIAMQVAKFWNLDTELIKPVLSHSIQQPAKRPPITGLIIKKAQNLLGYQPRSFVEGLKTVDEQLKSYAL
jgi:dTDP-4-dehydrorhamnose reductase